MSINKLKNSWIKDDNIITGVNDTVSLLNNGKTELQQDVTCNNNLTIKNYAICDKIPTLNTHLVNKLYVDSTKQDKITYVTTNNRILTWDENGIIAINDTTTSITNVYLPQITNTSQYGLTFKFYLTNGSTNPIRIKPYTNGTTYQYIGYSQYLTETQLAFNEFEEIFFSFSLTAVNSSMGTTGWYCFNYDRDPFKSSTVFEAGIGFSKPGIAMSLSEGSTFVIGGNLNVYNPNPINTGDGEGFNITPIEISYLSGLTSNIQQQLSNVLSSSSSLSNYALKTYVDTSINNLNIGQYLTISGALSLFQPKFILSDYATKTYVDESITGLNVLFFRQISDLNVSGLQANMNVVVTTIFNTGGINDQIDNINSSIGTIDNKLTTNDSNITSINNLLKPTISTLNGFLKIDIQNVSGKQSYTVTLPMYQYYEINGTYNGNIYLPVITSSMYGCQITFIKQSITTNITINQSTIGGSALATVFRLQGKATLQTTYQMITTNNVVSFIVSSENTWDVINSTNPSVQADQNTYLQDQITALQLADVNFTDKNDMQDSLILPSALATTQISYDSVGLETTIDKNVVLGTSTGISSVNIATNSFYTNDNNYHMNSYQQITGDVTLTLPLKTQYEITVASCTITLPSMGFTLWGLETSFKKRLTTGIVTINRGGTNVFRLYQSNNTASATSLTMPYKNTYIKMQLLGGTGIWNIINTDMMTYSPSDVYYGTKLLPFKTNPVDITASQNWMTSQPSIYYGMNIYNITSNITITLRNADDSDYFEGFELMFKRLGTITNTLTITCQSPDVMVFGGAASALTQSVTAPTYGFTLKLIRTRPNAMWCIINL